MKFSTTVPNVAKMVEQGRRQHRRETERAALIATDRASREAKEHIQSRMRSVGLGRLANAVGQTSGLMKGQKDGFYGVIFAKGQRAIDNRGAAAIEAYSQGVTIRARNTTWLAYATRAIPRLVGRRRMTPFLYQTQGFESSIGPLEFKQVSATLALLIIENVQVSTKSGLARKDLGSRSRSKSHVRKRQIVAFVLIKMTRRAQRFDEKLIVAIYARRVASYMSEAMSKPDSPTGS